jgi:hypothetical protein
MASLAPSPFNPSHSVEFNLDRGQIALRDAGERLLVPADALLALCRHAGPEALRDFGQRLGTEAGRRTAERLGDVSTASVETVVNQLGGDLALLGVGSLELERWGKALIFAISYSPFGAGGDDLVAAILQGAIQRAFGRDTGVVRLERNDRRARFLITSQAGAARVQRWLDAGSSFGEALARLDRGEA